MIVRVASLYPETRRLHQPLNIIRPDVSLHSEIIIYQPTLTVDIPTNDEQATISTGASNGKKASNRQSANNKVDEVATSMANANKKQVIMQYSRYIIEVMTKLFGLKLLQRLLSLAGFGDSFVDLQQAHPYLLGRLLFFLVASSIVPANPLIANDKFNALNMVALTSDTVEALQDLKDVFARTRQKEQSPK